MSSLDRIVSRHCKLIPRAVDLDHVARANHAVGKQIGVPADRQAIVIRLPLPRVTNRTSTSPSSSDASATQARELASKPAYGGCCST